MLVAINFFNAGQFVQPSILVIDSALQHTAQFMPEPDKLRLWLTPVSYTHLTLPTKRIV